MASKDKKEVAEADKTSKANPKDTSDLGLLEEDDDFEEFPAEGELQKVAWKKAFRNIRINFQNGLPRRRTRPT